MNSSPRTILCVIVAAVLTAGVSSAQVTISNNAFNAPTTFVSSVGTGVTIGTSAPVPPFAGSLGYLRRAAGAANASYIPTGYAVNPTSDGSFGQTSPGYTIQFWHSPDNPTTFSYIWGDSANVSPLGGASGGAFRCFANGAGPTTNQNLTARGLPNQCFTNVQPLATAGVGGWVHVAFRYDATTNNCQWLVNGVPDTAVAQTAGVYNWSMGNLTMVGANSTSSAVGAGGYDEIRIYDWARSDADIAADYMLFALGTGPSGESNIPDAVYFPAEVAVVPHTAFVGTNSDATAADVRIIADGTRMQWGANSVGQAGLPSTMILNFEGPIAAQAPFDPYAVGFRDVPANATSYSTAAAPAVTVGHNLSTPVNPASFALPDGIGLGALGVTLLSVPLPYTYGSPDFVLYLPPGIFTHGDLVRMQGVAPDPGYPGMVGGTNEVAMVYSDCQGNTGSPSVGPHAHVECRGAGMIQVEGSWEIHNTGSVDIAQVIIDLATATGGPGGVMTAFNPTGALNTGGMLSTGDSYRRGTEIYAGLDFTVAGFPAGGYTEVLNGGSVTGLPSGLQFDFQQGGPAFDACIDSLIFDCGDATTGSAAGASANLSGDTAIGATVTVTFTNGTVLMGTLVADPGDPQAAVVDL